MHWTYETFEKDSDLEQGDLLQPTADLRAVLQEVHPHFCSEKYVGFVVATQSCDLVRRTASSSARYISVAAVRSLDQVLPKLLEQVASPVGPGLFLGTSQLTVRMFLNRLLDQNEQALGLFYLHGDADVGLGDNSVAFLRVTVALREQHYDKLVAARTGRLHPEFRAKFGWLLGNLYARAASPDWSDREPETKKKRIVESLLSERDPGRGPKWIEDDLVEAGRVAKVEFSGRPHEAILAELETHRPKPRIERVVEIAVAEARRLVPTEFRLNDARERLQKIVTECAEAGTEHTATVAKLIDTAIELMQGSGGSEKQLNDFKKKLSANGTLKKLVG